MQTIISASWIKLVMADVLRSGFGKTEWLLLSWKEGSLQCGDSTMLFSCMHFSLEG